MVDNLSNVRKALHSCLSEQPDFLNINTYIDKELWVDIQLVGGQLLKLLTKNTLTPRQISNISDNIDNIILGMLDIDAPKAVHCIDFLGEIVVELETLLVEYEEYEVCVNLRNLNSYKNKTFPIIQK